MIDVNTLQARFPTLSHRVYLSSGSHGLLSTDVQQAYAAYINECLIYGANWEGWLGRYEAVRSSVARLLGAKSTEIAVTSSASEGINALASAFDFTGERNKIVVSNFEFPTSAQIWHAQEGRGGHVVHVRESQDGYIPLESFEEAIDEHTKIVAISHVCYRHGAKLDVKGIAEIAKRKGALLILDCYQSVGTEPLNVKELGVDFAVGGMMKYLLGSSGVGFLYIREELVESLTPSSSGWYAQADFFAMDIFANNPSPTARRFEAGTPAVPGCFAAEAGLGIIHEFGIEAIGAHIRDLTGRCMDSLRESGWQVVTPRDDLRRGPMVAIRSSDDAALVGRLAENGIVTSCRDGNVRCGFHFYNGEEDVARLLRALERHRDLGA
ncbi:aminotransferase class V-fold PLP-dependent enzyme [Mesorhizobium retamae]|uniref:Aminotransferase class V-fold PLP-dependent enzyme n=1 Tax=Mesorhizobium retamae TaxID=2912854 RepID=A0ABS9QK62_9HYPH|nr:aminotransferase class V-fold PLP-dependent enzyme [Mesorhizobium sp. IRAMC:0171]MCG7507827.1 aminotransferase class V-fold PLP-dependent enzyme [Mesorhizobium sp. IRAMC:0171]